MRKILYTKRKFGKEGKHAIGKIIQESEEM